MGMNILFVICVALVSVEGQFSNTEYRLDSAPLVNNARYEIQPSIGHEIEYSPETARISNQGRRHIENNRRGNLQNTRPNINAQTFELKPNANVYQINDRSFEILPENLRQNSNQPLNQNNARFQGPNNREYVQNLNINIDNQKPNSRNKLRTNLDSTTKLPPRKDLYNLENNPAIDNVRTYENIPNQYQNTAINEDGRQNEQQSQFNLDKTSQSQGDQQNYAADDNVRTSSNTNTRQNENNENKQNSNRHTEANQRAIDNNGSGNQQNVNSNKKYENKPNRQNTDTRKDNRNRETYGVTTETTRRNTIHDRTVTGGTKSTEENELPSKSSSERRSEDNEDDRWIWMSSSNSTASKKTTIAPVLPTVDDRAAFDGDKCPAGQVRYNNICVDTD